MAKAEGGDFKEAIRLFSRALQLDPTHEAAKKHLKQAEFQLSATATAATSNRKTNDTTTMR